MQSPRSVVVVVKWTRSPVLQLPVSGQQIIIARSLMHFVICWAGSLLAKKGQF